MSTLPIKSIRVDDVPLSGPSDTASLLTRTPGRLAHEGWELTQSEEGVCAEKGERSLLIPWSQIRLIEHEQLPAEELSSPARQPRTRKPANLENPS